jgi:optic atrophy 3 protein
MRMRLGILHDPEAQQRMHEREQRAAEERKKKEEAPTVRTEEEQKKYEERKAREAQEEKDGKPKQEKSTKVKIRPLSDARAIELGANFFSEAFIFMVAVGLILLENWRSSRKSSQRRDEVAERLEALEAQVERLQQEHHLPELEALNEKIKRVRAERKRNQSSWYNPFSWFRRSGSEFDDDDDDEYEGVPGEVEGQKGEHKQAVAPTESVVKDSKPAKSLEKPESGPPSPARLDTVKADSKQR